MSDQADVAPPAVVEAFAATVTYRLEPDGMGTRFPLVVDRLLAGRLGPGELDAALAELSILAAELRALPVDRVVWSLADLRKAEPAGVSVNARASSAYGCLVAGDGRPLVDVLVERVLAAKAAGTSVRVASPEAARSSREGAFLVAVGLALAIGGALFLPRAVLAPPGAQREAHGPALWSLGILSLLAGAYRLWASRRPALADLVRRHPVPSLLIALAVTGGLFALAWR